VEVNSRGRKSEARLLSIRDGEQIKDVLFQMLPAAVIGGRTVDEEGDPLADVAVFAQRKKPGGKLETAGTERTNDRGEFRFHGLFPGRYLIVAFPPPDFHDYDRQHERTNADSRKPDLRYLPTYYPGVFDAAQASLVTLRAGEEMPLNLTLVPAQTYRVRGIVTGIPADKKVAVELTSTVNQAILRSNEADENGQFEVRGVPPGTYLARASIGAEDQMMTAQQRVEIVAADVDGVKLTPMRSFVVTGEVISDARRRSSGMRYTVDLRLLEAADDSEFFINLEALGQNAAADQFGRFQWNNVRPGRYSVQVYSEDRDTFLKSVMLGESEVDTGFTLRGPASLTVVLGQSGGRLEGIVTDHDQPVADATVVFVPEEKYRKIRSHFAIASTDQRGNFTVRGLAPGTYSAFAWQDVDDGLYYDSSFLKSQEANATSVKVEERSQQSVALKLSAVGEEWR